MSTNDSSWLLRLSMNSNAVFSTLCGVAFVLGASPISNAIGLALPIILIGVGISLLVFATGLFLNSRRKIVNQIEAWLAVGLDFGWVIGSVILIWAGLLTTTGNWAVAVVADIVLIFALLQLVGLLRMRKTGAGGPIVMAHDER